MHDHHEHEHPHGPGEQPKKNRASRTNGEAIETGNVATT